MAFAWHGAARAEEVVNLDPLALIQPLLDQLDIAGIIDRHLRPDPQREYSHGQVLSLLLAARLCQPTALIHATRLTSRQRQSLHQLSLPTPAQTLRRILDPVPTG